MKRDASSTQAIDALTGNTAASEMKKYMVSYGLFPTQASAVLGAMTIEDREELLRALLGL